MSWGQGAHELWDPPASPGGHALAPQACQRPFSSGTAPPTAPLSPPATQGSQTPTHQDNLLYSDAPAFSPSLRVDNLVT